MDIIECIRRSPTPWHCAAIVSERLVERGFTRLTFQESWQLQFGCSYFIETNGTVIAFSLPKGPDIRRSLMLASHTDSPALKVKRHPDTHCHAMHSLLVEPYGSPLLRTWFDRDLRLAGRTFHTAQEGVEQKLISLDAPLLTIPSLAIHLQRKELPIEKQKQLKPLVALGSNPPSLEELIGSERLVGFDLFAVPAEEPKRLGNGLIAGYRLDNLASVFAALHGFLEGENNEDMTLFTAFNHEEIGSSSEVGAKSALLEDTLRRIADALFTARDAYYKLKAGAFALSIDMAHALHPNFPECYDQDNAPLLGQGIALKHNANLQYASHPQTAAAIEALAKKTHTPLQHFTGHADMPCGSTIGNIMAHTLGIPVLDIGIPQLAMHSARELIAESDFNALQHLCTEVTKGAL